MDEKTVKTEVCPKCEGNGYERPTPPFIPKQIGLNSMLKRCSVCNGSGKVPKSTLQEGKKL